MLEKNPFKDQVSLYNLSTCPRKETDFMNLGLRNVGSEDRFYLPKLILKKLFFENRWQRKDVCLCSRSKPFWIDTVRQLQRKSHQYSLFLTFDFRIYPIFDCAGYMLLLFCYVKLCFSCLEDFGNY